jgi:hypothetical protein
MPSKGISRMEALSMAGMFGLQDAANALSAGEWIEITLTKDEKPGWTLPVVFERVDREGAACAEHRPPRDPGVARSARGRAEDVQDEEQGRAEHQGEESSRREHGPILDARSGRLRAFSVTKATLPKGS